MKDIDEVLRRKRAQFEQLRKQIELLQEASDTLRAIAPLLADDNSADDGAVLGEVEDERRGLDQNVADQKAMAAKAGFGSGSTTASNSTTPPWP